MISFNAEQRFIVTGASSGTGKGVALLLNELGASVIGIGRNEKRLDEMKAVAKEVVRNKIRINCISPTNIRTENMPQEYVDSQIAFYPLGFGKANDVANFVAFLLSDKAGWITGQNYIMDCASF